MIPTPDGWMRLERQDFIHLRSPVAHPVGELRYRELAGLPRPARVLADERIALSRPAFEPSEIGAPERITTDEGEHGAIVKVTGTLGGHAVVRVIGIVYAEHVTAIVDGFAVKPEYFADFETIARDVTRRITLGLGTRRRRYVYRRPPGWQALRHFMAAHFIPPDHPRNAEHIVVYPAVPRGAPVDLVIRSTLEDQIGRIDDLEMLGDRELVTREGLRGRRYRVRTASGTGKGRTHDVAVLEDAHYVYPLRYDEGSGDVFAALCATIEPLAPLPITTATTKRDRLAVVGGVVPWNAAQRFVEVDGFAERVRLPIASLPAQGERYHALYIPAGELFEHAGHVMRPPHDRAPVACEIDTVHHEQQWQHLLVAGLSGALRATDAIVVPSEAVAQLYARVLAGWRARFGFPDVQTVVVAPAIDADAVHRDEAVRARVRRELGIADDTVVIAAFVGLVEPYAALVARWREAAPPAMLVLAGRSRADAEELRRCARTAGVGDRVIVLDPSSRSAVMATADVHLQLATTVDDASPAAVLEAMALGLPVIATRWATVAGLVRAETGIAIDLAVAAVAGELRDGVFGLPPATLARGLASAVRVDPAAVLGAIGELARDRERRQRLGAEAAVIARRDHALADASHRRTTMLDELAARAADHEPPPVRPIVDVDDVVRTLASHPLEPATEIALADPSALAFVPEAADPAFRARAETVIAKLATPRPAHEVADDFAVARLINYHVVTRAPQTVRPPDRLVRASDSTAPLRDRIAMLGAFDKRDESAPHGTSHAAYAYAVGLARTGRFAAIDAYHRHDVKDRFAPPAGVPVERRDARELATTPVRYQAIHVAHGDQVTYVPHVLRPQADWAPVVCEIGSTHHPQQWLGLLVAAASHAVRPSDGFIYASHAAESIHRRAWERWQERMPLPSPQRAVITNAIDCDAHARDGALRETTRAELALAAEDVAFLVFGRLSAYTKGDQVAVVALWREVVRAAPHALLVIAGASEDPVHVEHLRRVAREAGVADRVIVLDNPYARWPRARTALMSAADALVHPSTGLEETSSLVLLEAMAHGLPLVASRWSGAPELVGDGDGHLIDVCAAPVSADLRATVFGRTAHVHNGEVARYAALDGKQLIDAVVQLATNAAHRRACAESALRSVRARHALPAAMRRRVDFIDELAARAAREPTPRIQPLVDLDDMVRTLAGASR